MAKFEIIRDDDGTIRGYKLGKYYLIKHYYWNNNYNWIINTSGQFYYFSDELSRAIANNDVMLVNSCKSGKEKLIQLSNEANYNG